VLDIKIDAAFVYYSVEGKVMKVAKSGGTPVALAAGTTVTNLAVNSSHVFWVDGGNYVRRVSKSGGATDVLSSAANMAQQVVADSSYVYFSSYGLIAIRKIPVGGGAATTVCAGSPKRMALDSVQGAVLWTNFDSVRGCSTSAPHSWVVASGQNGPSGIAIDKASAAYWTNAGPGLKAVMGPGAVAIAVDAAFGPIAVDDSRAYWYNYVESKIKRVSKYGGAVETVASSVVASAIAVDDESVYHAAHNILAKTDK
jgi:hypothetical protein